VPVGWRSISAPLNLPYSVRWLMRSTKRSERRRGHGSMRKAQCVKETYARGGEKALMKSKWSHLTKIAH
jgi:hypothetical protein